MSKKILFVYNDGRKERIDRLNRGQEAPTEFLYGFPYLDRERYAPDFVETSDLTPKKFNLSYWKLLRSDRKFGFDYGLGRSRHKFFGHIDYLNRYDLIIGTNDSLSLGLLYFKRIGRLNSKIVFLGMGSGRTLSHLKNLDNNEYSKYKKELGESIKHSSALVLLGEGEYRFVQEEFREWREKIRLIPFGVDTNYWKPGPRNDIGIGAAYCLFVGNDPNRDYSLLVDVAKSCPNINFIFVSSKISRVECPQNVQLLVGNIWKSQVSDDRLRQLYQGARLVLLPLRDTIQPSGQSVALQAMACGTPVVITKTKGLWDAQVMNDMENCILVEPGRPADIIQVLQNMDNLATELDAISRNGLSTVQRHYRITKFSLQLEKLLDEKLQHVIKD